MTDNRPGAPALPPYVDFAAVLREDLEEIQGHREAGRPDTDLETLGQSSEIPGARREPEQLVGLALSGGGIRSAAFSMGVTQALEAAGVFAKVNFLSTVSGGGYIGASIVAAMHRKPDQFPFATAEAIGQPVAAADVVDSEAVRRIRDRCRYLLPHGRFDLLVSLAIILRGLVVNATMVAAPIFAAAAATLLFYPNVEDLSRSWLSRLFERPGPTSGPLDTLLASDFVLSKLITLCLLAWCIPWAVQRSVTASVRKSDARVLPDPASLQSRAMGTALGALMLVLALEAQQPVLRLVLDFSDGPSGRTLTWDRLGGLAAAVSAGTVALAFTWRFLIGTLQQAAGRRTWIASAKAALGRTALWLLASTLPLLLYGTYVGLVAAALSAGDRPPAAFAWLFGTIGLPWPIAISITSVAAVVLWSSSIGPLPATLLDAAWRRSPAARSFRTLVLAGGAVLTLLSAWPAQTLLAATGMFEAAFTATACYVGMACILGALTVLFTENATSLHSLYRDRLDEAFDYRAADGRPLMLSDLRRTNPPIDGERSYPKLLINAAVNMQGSAANRRARGADYFMFSPTRVGSDATGYADAHDFEAAEPQVDLATAVAISGAAVSAAMGRASVPPLGPTLALLNVRLGYWLRNPRFARDLRAAAAAARRDWTLPYLLLEAFGLLTEKRSKVYVTDGGHIDNIGVRQLLRRRCDLIIVSDAEADPGMNFAALIDVQRFARIDLGIQIELPWRDIRDAALARRARIATGADTASPDNAHAALGSIHYPELGEHPRKEGILLYIKASMTGDERDYVLDYERRFPAFPHEPTGDQFFTEEQFEAYRALGYHATAQALPLLDGLP